MKKIYLIVAAFSFAAMTGCSDYLDQDLKSDVPGSEYYGTPNGFASLLNASYSSLRTIYGGDPWMFEAGTDLFASGRSQVDVSGMYTNAYTSANSAVATFYTEHYKAISLANEVIYWGGSDASRAQAVAEARGLRALYYLNMAQQFGGVPLIKERVSGVLVQAERASAQDVYDFVITELTDLVGSSLPNEATDGTFNKKAANHYLAKAYLCRGYLTGNNADFTNAISAAKAAGAGQSLNTPFATLFSNDGENNAEVLFKVTYDVKTVNKDTDGNKQQAHFCDYLDGQEKGHKYTSSTLTPTLWMHEVFNTNTTNPAQDERYEATFMTELRKSYWDYYDPELKDESAVTYYYCPSWEIAHVDTWRAALPSRAGAIVVEMLPEGNNINNKHTTYEAKMKEDVYGVASFRKFDDTDNGKKVFSVTSSMRDIYLARLAETNLIAAEACIKLNDQAGAVTYVNIVRNRAKATAATATEMNLDYILNERARELAGEYHRWTDLTRTGKLAEYVEKYNPDVSAGAVTKKYYLRPIPLSAIELNPALEGHQNEGWD